MPHARGPEKPEQRRLMLNKWSLETSPPELRQPLAYVLHLRSYWKPEGRAKLIVPTSWMEFLAFADDKCKRDCVVDRCCPFRDVRFESDAGTRLIPSGEELPRDVVSRLLASFGVDNCLPTLVSRAFESIPRTSLRSDMAATNRIDFALVLGHGSNNTEKKIPESITNTRCLLLGMKESTQVQCPHVASFDYCSGPRPLASTPEELSSHGQLHLARLASLMKREAVGAASESFPEWLVLFGLVYDAHHVRVVAYVPYRRKLDVIECVAYTVDELSIRFITGAPTCELALERLRLLSALTTLRRHVLHLSKSLFTTIGSLGGIKRTDNCPSFLFDCSAQAHDQHNSDDSESLNQCACLGSSEYCSSEYTTCPSSIRACEPSDVPVLGYGEALSSSCKSFVSSFCSSCLSLLESTSTLDSLDSEDSRCRNSDYMEPSTISGGDNIVPCPNKLTQTKKREIIAWAREVIPTEHPVKDTYRMVIHHSHSRL